MPQETSAWGGMTPAQAAEVFPTPATTEVDPIDHDDQLQRMIDAYERPILNAMQEERYSHGTVGHVRNLVRQAIEQAWDAGHACARQNDI